MNLINILSFILGVIAYTISQLAQHRKLKWSDSPIGFWGKDSDVRKYSSDAKKRFSPPDNFYYRFFKIKYGEKFPLSATALVFLTDGYHLCQWFFTKLLILSIITFEGDFSIKWFLIYLGIWYLIFNLTYKLLSK